MCQTHFGLVSNIFTFHRERYCLDFWYDVSTILTWWVNIRHEVMNSIIIMKTSIIFKNLGNFFWTVIQILNITSSYGHKCGNRKQTSDNALDTPYVSVYEVKLHFKHMVRVWCMIIVLNFEKKSWWCRCLENWMYSRWITFAWTISSSRK